MTSSIEAPPDDFSEFGADVEVEEAGLFATFRDTLIAPKRAMSSLAADSRHRWIWPLGMLALLGMIRVVVQMPAKTKFDQAVRASSEMNLGMPMGGGGAVIQIFILVLALLGGLFVGTLVLTAVLQFISTIFGGQLTFRALLNTVSWAKTPLIFGELLRIVHAAIGGYDPCSKGLAGLVCPEPSFGATKHSLLEPLLAQMDLWNIWFLVLIGVALASAAKISRGKAIAGVLIILALSVSLGMAGIAANNAFAGMMP